MNRKHKVASLKVEDLEKRTAPFVGALPDAVPEHSQAQLNAPSLRDPIPRRPVDFEILEGEMLNNPSLRGTPVRGPVEYEVLETQLAGDAISQPSLRDPELRKPVEFEILEGD